jgi:adenylosuccinate synthase
MPAELTDETGELIRQRGREWGVNTGRPRRTGWFDTVAARQTSRLNGVTEIALTLVDVLDVFAEIGLCTGYDFGDRVINHVPALLDPWKARLRNSSSWRAGNRTLPGCARLTSCRRRPGAISR